MGREDKASWKANYFSKLVQYLEEYPKCFIVGADNVGSKQMQQIRIGLRGTAVVLMGKNTMMRKAIKGHVEKNPALEKLLPHIRGNVGFVFTNAELSDVREKLLENKVQAPAKPGAIAPMDVIVPAQNTGLGPEKNIFLPGFGYRYQDFQGNYWNDQRCPHFEGRWEGRRFRSYTSEHVEHLSISYGLQVQQVYDSGTIFEPKILDIKPEDLRERFLAGVRNVAAVSLAVGYPTVASAPHSVINGFKNLLAVAAATDVTFKEAETVKEFIKDPSKFLSAAAATAPAASAPAKAEKKEEKKEESEEEDDDMGFGLFD